MKINKIKIVNFKCFEGEFELELNDGVNIIVGNNEAGKSTILEAIHLALTGILNGRNIRNEISEYIFNRNVIEEYLKNVNSNNSTELPYILIEIYFDGDDNPILEGNGNSFRENAKGISFKILFDDKYQAEYESLVKIGDVKSIPIEYYIVSWSSFARENITPKSIPFKSAMIDSSSNNYLSCSDIYVSRIIKDNLEQEDITNIAQAHRKMRDEFMSNQTIKDINGKINQSKSLTDKKIELSVELGTKNAWESSLITQLDKIPFNYIGKGEQCIVKTELAITNNKAKNAGIILIEEPENHLSYSKLNQLISCISKKYQDKQIIISTHSSFVANKLGLNNLILLNNLKTTRFNDMGVSTQDFFEKIAGYDTLRLILSKKAILVEGDSDELVVQKAYMMSHEGKLPIEDGIDVISVGTSFLRFLEISDKLQKPVAVVTDNDGDLVALQEKYKNYINSNAKSYVKICVDMTVDEGNLMIGKSHYNYNTLEPKILKVNSLETMNDILNTSFTDIDELRKYMKHNKTDCAYKIFETDKEIIFPDYIMEAVSWKIN
ncbi:ATP-dependent nuclease [Ruminiclostridium cellobioparum]|uniref:ATP-dependent nuclease n=1 Tax=Ruminiclostridium cellobioparum TaxID=29355 RepID=UPI0028A823E6|nr:AAA family ATPase [Ruminiclostridium cellobioparum]